MNDTVQPEIFSLFPNYSRAVVVVRNARIATYNPRIAKFLNEEQARCREAGAKSLEDPRITAWEDAFRRFGADPKESPPSIKGLVQRVVRGKSIGYINDAVALFNAFSLTLLAHPDRFGAECN